MNTVDIGNRFFILLLSLAFFGCSNQNDMPPLETPDTYRYLALGDSYTIGESVAENLRFPVQLTAQLKENGMAVAEPMIIAKTGWTTDELQKAIDEVDIKGDTYDFVTLLIGVNNQYRGYSLDQYRIDFDRLLQQAVAFAGQNPDRVFVLSIPDYGVTPFAQEKDPEKIAVEIDDFNLANKTISQGYRVHYVDITAISRRAASDSALLAVDRLHPSGLMYRLWVEELLPVVLESLIDLSKRCLQKLKWAFLSISFEFFIA